jgi:hypothetical protein
LIMNQFMQQMQERIEAMQESDIIK